MRDQNHQACSVCRSLSPCLFRVLSKDRTLAVTAFPTTRGRGVGWGRLRQERAWLAAHRAESGAGGREDRGRASAIAEGRGRRTPELSLAEAAESTTKPPGDTRKGTRSSCWKVRASTGWECQSDIQGKARGLEPGVLPGPEGGCDGQLFAGAGGEKTEPQAQGRGFEPQPGSPRAAPVKELGRHNGVEPGGL